MRACLDLSDLDAVLRIARPGTMIRLTDGRWTTRGNWVFADWRRQLPDGCTIEGDGPETVIALENPVMQVGGVMRPDNDANVLWAGAGCTLRNLTIDCNATGNPGLNVGGPRFHGRFTVENVTIRGLRGTTNKVEVFAISSEGATGGSVVRKVTVRDCVPDSYVSGIFVGGDPTSLLSVVEDCDVDLGSGNWFGYSANFSTAIRRCKARGAAAWFHNDHGPTEDVVIDSCSGEATYAVVRMVATVTGLRREVSVVGGRFAAPRGVELWDRVGGGMPGGVLFHNVILDCPLIASIASSQSGCGATGCVLPDKVEFLRTPVSPDGVFISCHNAAGNPIRVTRKINQ